MLFKEGEELVIRQVYDVIGGHIGSYEQLWDYIRYKNMSLEEGLYNLKRKTFNRNRHEQKYYASSGIERKIYTYGFDYPFAELQIIFYLIKCNIQFFD